MKYDKIKRGDKVYFRYRIYDQVTKKTKDVTASTLKELKAKVLVAEEKAAKNIIDDKITFSAFMDNWLKTVHLIDKKDSTVELYSANFKNHIKSYRVGLIQIGNLKAIDMQEHYNLIYEEKMSSNIVKSVHKIVSPCLRYAQETGRIVNNFAPSLKIPQSTDDIMNKKDKVNPMTLEQQFEFIKLLKGHDHEVLFNMALDTGMRQGELFALRWEDVNFEKQVIYVNESFRFVKVAEGKKRVGKFTDTKTKSSSRVIPLPERTAEFLKAHRVKQQEKFDRLELTMTDQSLIFSTASGRPFDSRNILKRIKTIYKHMGIEEKNFHDLRHTYATRLFELGEQPKTVQVLLGHSNVNVTMSTYTHILDLTKEHATSMIDQLYKKKTTTLKVVKIPDRSSHWENSGKTLKRIK